MRVRSVEGMGGSGLGTGYSRSAASCRRSSADASGHSRNGKQSLIAAAFDERFAAVVGSSPGAPIASPALFSSAQYYGETVKFVQEKRGWGVGVGEAGGGVGLRLGL